MKASIHWPLFAMLTFCQGVNAQWEITSTGAAHIQTFNGQGQAQVATMPAGFRGHRSSNAFGLSWATAGYGSTHARFGLGNTGLPGPEGFVNLGVNGTGATATNRALGWFSAATSGNFHASVDTPYWLIVRLRNSTDETLSALAISFTLLRWTGVGTEWQILGRHSASGASGSFINIGAGTLTTFASTGGNTVINPLVSQTISFTLTGLAVAPGADHYLAVGYRSATNDVSAPPVLGMDDFTVTATGGGTPPPAAIFPADAGLLDVTQAPYQADPTGTSDARAAIQAALNDAHGMDRRRTVYLPAGTYRLSGGIHFPGPGVTLQGQGRDRTILKLDNNAATFGNPALPQPVLSTISPGASSNTNFIINVFDLTVDIGAGNPGASGIRYIGNNQSTLRDVRIRSSDPALLGWAGIDAETALLPGPGFLKNVEIVGFDHALRLGGYEYGLVAEDLTISAQRVAGLRIARQPFTARRVLSNNSVPALHLADEDAFVTLLDSRFSGGSASQPAIFGPGQLFARAVTSSGYRTILERGGQDMPSPQISEYTSSAPRTLFADSPAQSLNLPIVETPAVAWDPPSTWINVQHFGAVPGDLNDDSAAIQAAIDAATATRRTVYFPTGLYYLAQGVTIRGHVRHFIGMGSELRVAPPLFFTQAPVFRLTDTAEGLFQMERFFLSWSPGQKRCHWFRNERTQDVVLRHIFMGSGQGWIGSAGASRVFFEDVCSLADFSLGGTVQDPLPEARPQFIFGQSETVYGRQFNSEARWNKVRADGGTVWLLGFKTEQPGVILEARDSANVEVLGGVHTGRSDFPADMPVYLNDHARLSVVAMEVPHGTFPGPISTVVREIRGPDVRDLLAPTLPRRESGTLFALPLYTGYGMDRPVVSVSVDHLRRDEGQTLTFEFHRTGSTGAPLTAAYSLSGSATAGADCSSPPGTITFPAGSASVSLILSVTPDGLPELDETLTLSVAPSADYYPSNAAGSATSLLIDRDSFAPLALASTQPVARMLQLALTLRNGAPVAQTFRIVGPPGAGNPVWQASGQSGGPVFSWVDIKSTGRRLVELDGLDSAMLSDVPIGFPFNFYGSSFDIVHICTNGWMSFSERGNTWLNGDATIPNPYHPVNLVAFVYDDLIIDSEAAIYIGNPDPDTFIVQYDNVRRDNTQERFTGQVIFRRGGEIVMQVLSSTLGAGSSYSVGLQNGTGTVGVSVYHNVNGNSNFWTAGKAVRFTPPQPWVFGTPSTITIPANNSEPVLVTLNSTGLAVGQYTFQLQLTSDHPQWSARTVPVTLTVSDAARDTWRWNTFSQAQLSSGAADWTADPEGDGFPNFLEYALGLNPFLHAAQPPLTASFTSSLPGSLQLTFLRARADVTYTVEASSDLATWSTIATNPGSVSSIHPVTVTDTVPFSPQSRRFLRLRVQ